MSEQAISSVEEQANVGHTRSAETDIGKMTVLEALAEETTAVGVDMSHRSTQMGNGVDAEDD